MAPRRGTRLEEVLYSDDLERGGAETSYRNPLAAGAVQAQVRADGCSVWEPWQDTNAWCRVVSPFPGTFLALGCQGAETGPVRGRTRLERSALAEPASAGAPAHVHPPWSAISGVHASERASERARRGGASRGRALGGRAALGPPKSGAEGDYLRLRSLAARVILGLAPSSAIHVYEMTVGDGIYPKKFDSDPIDSTRLDTCARSLYWASLCVSAIHPNARSLGGGRCSRSPTLCVA